MNFCIPVTEQETVIRFSRAEEQAFIYTSDTTTMTKLDKLVETSEAYTLERVERVEGNIIAKSYICDNKRLLSFRKNGGRIPSDEERSAASERLKTWRQSQRNDNFKNQAISLERLL